MTRKDNLKRYHAKRDFAKTAEPKGEVKSGDGFGYLIQKHAATRLHYDFRLELDGVLKSWAVTRGPSLDPADKRLAVEVEDHPVEYGSFEGTIPKGQYGGGTVMLWDTGSWEPIGDPHEGLKKGKLEFIIHGQRLHGEWTLVRMKGRESDRGRNNWLLIKHRDKYAKGGDHDALLEQNDKSVISRRSMDKIAKENGHVWQSNENTEIIIKPEKKKTPKKNLAKLPPFIPPELATLTDAMPKGENWLHEIKFDGYRVLAYIEGGRVTMYTRNGLDWTHKFGNVPDELAKLPVDNAIIDGELVALNEKGVSSFIQLKNALGGTKPNLQYFAFDLLHLNGANLMKKPLIERKALMESLLKKTKHTVFYSAHFIENRGLLEKACRMGLEGLISKLADAAYHSGRGKNWLKVKCHKRQEFVIGGFTKSSTGASIIGSLLLGYYEGNDFVYAGRVGTGFDNDLARNLYRTLYAKKIPDMAYTRYSEAGRRGPGWKRGVVWVKPELVCEVEFTEWTEEGALRHPSFQGLREDKPAKSIRREEAMPLPQAVKKKAAVKPASSKPSVHSAKQNDKDAEVLGIRISHPDRIIYPGTDITKLQLVEYYASVADHMLPHVTGRPLSLIRCPEGSGEPCFFQRHIAHESPYIHDTGIKVKGRNEEYMMIKDAKGLISLIQWGAIELHPWGCKADKPDLPDRIIFDLDPDPGIPFSYVIEGVKEVRQRMKELGLESFIKTTGGKGLHVVVPIIRKYNWDVVKPFARAIAESMQMDNPKRYIATASKEKRKGKIFVDYLRNDLTATAVAPYSARARTGATVATPIDWKDLIASFEPAQFTIETLGKRLSKKPDPWEEMLRIKQQIAASHLKALKIK